MFGEKLLLLVFAPIITLILVLGWIWLMTTKRRHVSITLKGLGIAISVRADTPVSTEDLPNDQQSQI